jgi:PleD family two-component response regulator
VSEAIDGGTPRFTASFGVCATDGHAGFDDLLRIADRALYRAEHEGRGRVVTAGAAEHGRQSLVDAFSPAG